MLKYYEYLYRIRHLLRQGIALQILENLENFPVDLDPSLKEYHEKIASRINAARTNPIGDLRGDRYYIHKTRPFFLNGLVFYEVTFYRAVNRVSKFDRVIGFTDIEMTEEYSASLSIKPDHIEVLGQQMPIVLILNWEVSIRPCEFKNFARILGHDIQTRTDSNEYRYLMRALTRGSSNLLDLVDLPDERYEHVKAEATRDTRRAQVFPIIDQVRAKIRSGAQGQLILRYLLLRMRNEIIKRQYQSESCPRLSDMNLKWGCIPFETMPFCTSLPAHNPRYADLASSLAEGERAHELLARRVKNNVERHGALYTPLTDLQSFGDIASLISTYNSKLYYTHTHRKMEVDKDHVFIRGYEDDTVKILEAFQSSASQGIAGYTQAVHRWLDETSVVIDDPAKRDALLNLFSSSRVALIYGAAGTGKSTMVNHVANYFNDSDKLFLAHTHPAVDNLQRKVTAQNSEFRTVASQIHRGETEDEYDLLVIDESSTVSNADLLTILDNTSFRLLVLVGDIYQIESIQFGNWFGIVRSFLPETSVFELTTPYRTKSEQLLRFWNKTRNLDDDLTEVMTSNGYSTVLDKSLFESQSDDEIILCLNYDGLYGINNVNRFLQSGNPGEATHFRESIYKVGDPILFFDTDRFRPVIYNNLKGWIERIEYVPGLIEFDVRLDRSVSEFDVYRVDDLEWVGDSTVRFAVYESDMSDEDDDSLNTTMPFQVAYAVSIHKAQGLEYDSVKVVITEANEEEITHSIFYTAITRARERLLVFWTPETQQRVLGRLERITNRKDVSILTARRGITPVN